MKRIVSVAGIFVAAIVLAGCGVDSAVSSQERGSGTQPLSGAIDVHIHADPDDAEHPRNIDAVDIARLAHSRGMRGLVLKNHSYSTAPLAFFARKEAPGLEVFGAIALNFSVGGVNPAAVEHMTEIRNGWGRVVYMPTIDAEHQIRVTNQNRPAVSISRDGELLPAVKEVLALIAKHDLVLVTGHSSPEESLLLIREGRSAGVKHILVTHPINPAIAMTVAQMEQAAKGGAFLEFCARSVLGAKPLVSFDAFAEAIRKVGPDFCILSSDLGMEGTPLHPDGLMTLMQQLKERGFSDQELSKMLKENPARLLGLPLLGT